MTIDRELLGLVLQGGGFAPSDMEEHNRFWGSAQAGHGANSSPPWDDARGRSSAGGAVVVREGGSFRAQVGHW